MKSIDEAEAQARFDEILDEAQKHPIVVRRQGKEIAAIVGVVDYERLHYLRTHVKAHDTGREAVTLRKEILKDHRTVRRPLRGSLPAL